MACDITITAPDATAVVKDPEGNILATELIPSGVSQDIVVAAGGDATIIINDNAGAEVVNTQVASGTTQIFNIIIT